MPKENAKQVQIAKKNGENRRKRSEKRKKVDSIVKTSLVFV